MKYIYKILDMREVANNEYFFSTKILAMNFLKHEVEKEIQQDDEYGGSDLGLCGDREMRKFRALPPSKRQYDKISKYYSLWLRKIRLDDKRPSKIYWE